MYYRTMPSLRLDEELVEDGQGGQQVVPAYLRKLITWQRKDCEEASCRVLTNEAIKFIPAGFSNWARMQLEMCIRAHDLRNNCANQRTYRLGIDLKMRADPNATIVAYERKKSMMKDIFNRIAACALGSKDLERQRQLDYLDGEWGSRGAWVPPDYIPRRGGHNPALDQIDDIPSLRVSRHMVSTTRSARLLGMDLYQLWAPNGFLTGFEGKGKKKGFIADLEAAPKCLQAQVEERMRGKEASHFTLERAHTSSQAPHVVVTHAPGSHEGDGSIGQRDPCLSAGVSQPGDPATSDTGSSDDDERGSSLPPLRPSDGGLGSAVETAAKEVESSDVY